MDNWHYGEEYNLLHSSYELGFLSDLVIIKGPTILAHGCFPDQTFGIVKLYTEITVKSRFFRTLEATSNVVVIALWVNERHPHSTFFNSQYYLLCGEIFEKFSILISRIKCPITSRQMIMSLVLELHREASYISPRKCSSLVLVYWIQI